MNMLFRILLFIALLCSPSLKADEQFRQYYIGQPELELSYAVGDFIAIKHNYAGIGLLYPLSNLHYNPFIDLHGYRLDNGKWAGSFGVGFRTDFNDCSVIGANIYYDYRRGNHKRSFNQIGIGAEWLTDCWDIRINGYIPVGTRVHKENCRFVDYGDDFFAFRWDSEFAYTGIDAEIGAPIKRWCDVEIYGAAGPYYYERCSYRCFWGGYARLEANWKSILSMQVRVSYDHVYRTNVQGVFKLSLPFDWFCSNSCCNPCPSTWKKVYRNDMILTDHCCKWKWNW